MRSLILSLLFIVSPLASAQDLVEATVELTTDDKDGQHIDIERINIGNGAYADDSSLTVIMCVSSVKSRIESIKKAHEVLSATAIYLTPGNSFLAHVIAFDDSVKLTQFNCN